MASAGKRLRWTMTDGIAALRRTVLRRRRRTRMDDAQRGVEDLRGKYAGYEALGQDSAGPH